MKLLAENTSFNDYCKDVVWDIRLFCDRRFRMFVEAHIFGPLLYLLYSICGAIILGDSEHFCWSLAANEESKSMQHDFPRSHCPVVTGHSVEH